MSPRRASIDAETREQAALICDVLGSLHPSDVETTYRHVAQTVVGVQSGSILHPASVLARASFDAILAIEEIAAIAPGEIGNVVREFGLSESDRGRWLEAGGRIRDGWSPGDPNVLTGVNTADAWSETALPWAAFAVEVDQVSGATYFVDETVRPDPIGVVEYAVSPDVTIALVEATVTVDEIEDTLTVWPTDVVPETDSALND